MTNASMKRFVETGKNKPIEVRIEDIKFSDGKATIQAVVGDERLVHLEFVSPVTRLEKQESSGVFLLSQGELADVVIAKANDKPTVQLKPFLNTMG